MRVSKILQELEKTRSQFWNVNKIVGNFLNLLIKANGYKTVLEIGTSNGYSGIWITEALKQTKGHLYTIESHKKERFGLAQKNFKKANVEKFVTQILGHAPEAIPLKPKMFDLVFIDATKYEYPLYFEAIKNRIKKGGAAVADNTTSHRTELLQFFKIIKKNKSFAWTEFSTGSGFFVGIKK